MKSMTLKAMLGCAAAALLCTATMAQADMYLPPFYAAATQMKPEGKLGQIVRKEKIPTAIANAQAWRIAYVSSDMTGKKTIVTGIVISPKGPAPKGGRPIMSWAHGTTGTAQNCGPSQVGNPTAPLNEYFLMSGNAWTDYGVPAIQEFIKAGYVVVATDYQGLGGGGKHQYQLAVTQAHDTIDAVRAAGSLKATGAGKTAILYGWSQGGSAVTAAASAPDYINQKGTAYDGITIAGVVAMAPPDFKTLTPPGGLTDANAPIMMANIAKSFSASLPNFTHFTMTLWGAQAAFPDTLKLSDALTDEGVKAVETIMRNKCVHGSADAFNYAYGDQFATLIKPTIGNAKAWGQALIDSAGTNVKPVAPVIIYWGTKDIVAPPIMHKIYREEMCKMGGNVARVQLAGEKTHFATPGASQPLYLPWIADRLAGKPAPNGCLAEQIQN
jgi:pimeloyl-ACP methyl ester carboxylesterase